MDKILRQLIESGLAGLSVDARITVSEELANEIVALLLQENPQVEYCRIHIHAKNRITLDVKTPLWLWPFSVKLKLFGSVDFTHSPTIRAFLENHALLGKLVSLFNKLPEGVHFHEDQIAIDIGSFLHAPEQRMLLALIRAAEIKTEEGRLLLRVETGQ